MKIFLLDLIFFTRGLRRVIIQVWSMMSESGGQVVAFELRMREESGTYMCVGRWMGRDSAGGQQKISIGFAV
jgi:hypothetical protein